MISLLVSELVQTASLWSLNKANQPPDTWHFYQCVHVAWIKKICLLQSYVWRVHIFRAANFVRFRHTDIINSVKALIQQPPRWRPSDPIQQRLSHELYRGEDSPEVPGTSQAWNTVHKCILAGQGHTCGLRALISKWEGCERFIYAALFTAPIPWWGLATGGMKRKFPLQAQTTSSLQLKGQLQAHESWKKNKTKSQNFIISNQLEKNPKTL